MKAAKVALVAKVANVRKVVGVVKVGKPSLAGKVLKVDGHVRGVRLVKVIR